MSYDDINDLRKLIKKKQEQFQKLFSSYMLENLGINNNPSNELLVTAIDLILTVSKKMKMYKDKVEDVDENLYTEIKNLSNDELSQIALEAYMPGAISIIRFVIAQMFIKDEISSAEDLKSKIKELKNSFIEKKIENFNQYIDNLSDENKKITTDFIKNYNKGDPFRAWGPLYRFLLPFIYEIPLRNTVWNAIEVIRNRLLVELGIQNTWESKNSQGWNNKVRSYFGFEGPSNFGRQSAALMLHPKSIPDHKNAIQLVCYFDNGIIYSGCDRGIDISNDILKKINSNVNFWEGNIKEFDFNDCLFEELNNNKILEQFSEIIKHLKLKDNLQFAEEKNKELLQLISKIKNNEIAESNAELNSSKDDVNLYDASVQNDDNEEDIKSKAELSSSKNNINLYKSSKQINENKEEHQQEKTLELRDKKDEHKKTNNAENENKSEKNIKITVINAKNKDIKKIYPNIRSDEDYLKRENLAKYITEQIITDKIDPLNIGIYADWGMGKTQIINLIKKFINNNNSSFYYQNFWHSWYCWNYYYYWNFWDLWKKNEEKYYCETVDFNAWEYDDQEHIWASLIMKIMEKCKEYPSFYFRYILHKFIFYFKKNFGELLLKSVIIAGIYILIKDLNILDKNISKIIESFNIVLKMLFLVLIAASPDLIQFGFLNIDKMFLKCFKTPMYQDMLGFREEIRELIKFSIDFLSNKGEKRIVLIIDNLDRCSSLNIKQILDSICQFLEMCTPCGKNIMAIFAMDKSIIIEALKKEGVPEEKAVEYLDKIINFPIKLTIPNQIDELIERFFGKGSDSSNYLKEEFKKHKFNPRKLANIRYLDNMISNLYDRQLDTVAVDLYNLQQGFDKDWQSVSNIDNLIEKRVLDYFEKLYFCNIRRNVKYKSSEFDGVIFLENKKIIFEVKYILHKNLDEKIVDRFTNKMSILDISKNNYEFILAIYTNEFDTKKIEKLKLRLNAKLQRNLSKTKIVGQVYILTEYDLR